MNIQSDLDRARIGDAVEYALELKRESYREYFKPHRTPIFARLYINVQKFGSGPGLPLVEGQY